MKILHINAGNETGGGMYHILHLLKELNRDEFILGVFEEGELLRRANKLGIKTVCFANKAKFSITLIKQIATYMKKEGVNYVHTHGPRANVYAHMLKRIIDFNWIVTVHSDPDHDFLDKGLYGDFLSLLNMRAIKHADRIITVSEQFKEKLTHLGIADHKINCILNGIDFNKNISVLYRKEDFGLTKHDFVILMVARLEAVKGHQLAFQALKQLVKFYKKTHLMLIGDGSLKNSLQQNALSLNIENNVHFLGYRNDVDYFYKVADVTLLTSLSESFPLVLLESARAKTPVISTDVGCVRKLIPHEQLGWVIKPNDVHQLTKSLTEALALFKRGLLTIRGRNLYEFASTQFSVSTFADKTYHVYLSLEETDEGTKL